MLKKNIKIDIKKKKKRKESVPLYSLLSTPKAVSLFILVPRGEFIF
jgi:hypothetical protein